MKFTKIREIEEWSMPLHIMGRWGKELEEETITAECRLKAHDKRGYKTYYKVSNGEYIGMKFKDLYLYQQQNVDLLDSKFNFKKHLYEILA